MAEEKLVPAFRCSHSGKYYPGDYAKNWGRKYGIGLGPIPVSECLDTQDHMAAVESADDPASLMKPVGNTLAQVDFCLVPESEYNDNRLILAADDPRMVLRKRIVWENQAKKNPRIAERKAALLSI